MRCKFSAICKQSFMPAPGNLLPLLLLFLLLFCGMNVRAVNPALPVIPNASFNITDYGATDEGVATSAIQSAINAASAAGGGTVVIPAGTFLSGPIRLDNQINLHLNRGAILRMLPLDKYPGGTSNPENFISGSSLHDVAISGEGLIDGQGIPWWPYANKSGARRPRMIALSGCDRVLIEHVTLSNSPMFHIAMHANNVTVRAVTIRANPSTDPVNPGHNTDACDVSGTNILVQDCDISVGDDDFTCGGGTSDVLITNCTYGYGHGVSIGSPTSGGVSNLTVMDCTFNNTEAGIRIKSDRDRGGYLHDLNYLNLHMTNVNVPILIYAAYMATNHEYRDLNKLTPATAAGYPAQTVGPRTPIYRDITFSNITATVAAGHRAGLIWGLPEMNVSNVLLEKITIKADKPFGIYDAQNVRLVDCNIVTPKGVEPIVSTNAQITMSGR
jgi:polygalacturonase